MSKLIDAILIIGFFVIFAWAIIDNLSLIRQMIDILF
jgi:hypothetical protein